MQGLEVATDAERKVCSQEPASKGLFITMS